MTNGIQIGWAGDNLHLNHGPIDLLLHAEGTPAGVHAAYENASRLFHTVLIDLVQELPLLRTELPRNEILDELRNESGDKMLHEAKYTARNKVQNKTRNRVLSGHFRNGSVAQRMVQACLPLRSARLSPMAAVAGAVADYMLWALNEKVKLQRAWVNNGGDIAFSLNGDRKFHCGLVSEVGVGAITGDLWFNAGDPGRGIATSGRATRAGGGRSFSLGIADAVTVVAENAANADAAATLIANEVDLPEHEGIARKPATELDPDSDLGQRLVTTGVPLLTNHQCRQALESGAKYARKLHKLGQIYFAVLNLQKTFTVVGHSTLPATQFPEETGECL
jgi:ApbE superfamily uncharacterized protein (UPF0280 family)